MRKRQLAEIMACLVFVFACIWAQAQSTAPTSANAEPKTPNQSGSDQQGSAILIRGTKEAPLVVDVIPTIPNQEEIKKQEVRTDAELSTNRWIMIFTGVLTLFTLVQILLYLRERKESARNYRNEHRAWVSFRIIKITSFDSTHSPVFSFVCTNHGQYPARRVGFRAIMRLMPNRPLDKNELPKITGAWNEERTDLFPLSGESDSEKAVFNCNTKTLFSADELAQITSRERILVIGLEVKYFDISDAEHITRAYVAMQADDATLQKQTTNYLGDLSLVLQKLPGGSSLN